MNKLLGILVMVLALAFVGPSVASAYETSTPAAVQDGDKGKKKGKKKHKKHGKKKGAAKKKHAAKKKNKKGRKP